jgi:CRISPR/Cas system CSM-associated protein Csm5 (group 7 of RAMP superfamily)
MDQNDSDNDSGNVKDQENYDNDSGNDSGAVKDQFGDTTEPEKCSSSQRGLTVRSKVSKSKILVKYSKRGVPVGDGAKKLATFEGMVARSMVPITFESWLEVDKETKEACWQYVLVSHIIYLSF